MYRLSNSELMVEILDPSADQARFGVRYCTGGYIYQVTDAKRGALLTGPTYPDSFNWFDGQGIPDAFNLGPIRSAQGDDQDVLVMGIGQCDLIQQRVKTFCQWAVDAHDTQITLRTTQQFEASALTLTRSVSLMDRTLRSHTHLTNQGSTFIPLCWFPHPFYPQTSTDELVHFNLPLQAMEHEGYSLANNGFIRRKAWPEQKGFYLALDHAAHSPLTVLQRHPTLGMVSASCSYIPSFFPIWGNQHTFSWEPFFERRVAPQQSVTWWIDYHF